MTDDELCHWVATGTHNVSKEVACQMQAEWDDMDTIHIIGPRDDREPITTTPHKVKVATVQGDPQDISNPLT